MKEIELFVPGRLCLFGEHSDWAGGHRRDNPLLEKGYTLVAGTDQGITARVRRTPDAFILSSVIPGGGTMGPFTFTWSADELFRAAREGGFASYAAGVASFILEEFGTGGMEIRGVDMDLPMKKGLSSSATICILVARAFSILYDLGLSVYEEMDIAYRGEILTGSECGRMDQACAFGRIPVLMTFDADDVTCETLRPQERIDLLIVDLASKKNTRKILSDLNACFPNTDGHIPAGVRRALGPINADIVRKVRVAVEAGDGKKAGRLMTEAQATFDRLIAPACPEELCAPRLHKILEYPGIGDLVWGGKGVGSQGDGCAQFVVRGKKEGKELAALLKEKEGLTSLPLAIKPDVKENKPRIKQI